MRDRIRLYARLCDLAADVIANHQEAGARIARGLAAMFREEASDAEEHDERQKEERRREGYPT